MVAGKAVVVVSSVWVIMALALSTQQCLRSYHPPPTPDPKGPSCVVRAMGRVKVHVRLDLRERVCVCHVGFRASKVYKTPKAFKTKIGVKPFGSSKLERINEPPSCSYRQLM